MSSIVDEIVSLWSDVNPVVGYTSGYLGKLTALLFQTPENVEKLYQRIEYLTTRLDEIADLDIRTAARAVLVSQRTQLELARPSGAGPSGTGAGGVYAAADGIFYILLKGDGNKPWVAGYLEVVREMIVFEAERWAEGNYTAEIRKECLNTVGYVDGNLKAMLQANPTVSSQVRAIEKALQRYQEIFYSPGLASSEFKVYWPALLEGDAASGPVRARGYPGTLKNYYALQMNEADVELQAKSWMQLDMPVTLDLARRIAPKVGAAQDSSLQTVWDAVSRNYAVDFSAEKMQKVLKACNDFGQRYIIGFTSADKVLFDPTPGYLVNLVTGGEDFAVDYLTDKPYSQLYLTASKNTSLLTMINILVHEASHGFNFVMSARKAPKLLNLNTSIEVPMTEGQAFYREYQYYAAAADLVGQTGLDPVQQAYLNLYGTTPVDQANAVQAAQLETYIWRVIRYIRALCDTEVNGGKRTYTDFIAWAAAATGLSEETLHGECFTFLAAPGYAPCYALGGAIYGFLQTKGIPNGVQEAAFNTEASSIGFSSWPVDQARLAKIAAGDRAPAGAAP
ncbi:hypothetical protein WNZ15_17235 [Roseibium sp. AS2]|uniref:hypothetical protein n=1 Tax=Roseibium sp. AS2 TaxID=3135781 RepID=UPI003177AD03